VKIKVYFNVEEPIRLRMFIGNTKDRIAWVDFRYENIPMFIFVAFFELFALNLFLSCNYLKIMINI
jgi:hypothetical protein